MFHFLSAIDPLLARYGYAFVATTVFGEAFGLPLPGESAIAAASTLSQRGDMSPHMLVPIVAVAAFLGDNVGYAIGRFGGRPLTQRLGHYVWVTPERLDHVEKVFHRYGVGIIIVARFIVLLRQLNGVIAGIANVPWLWFAAANAVGALLWATVWSLGPYYLSGVVRNLF